jgi:hypothetical protein
MKLVNVEYIDSSIFIYCKKSKEVEFERLTLEQISYVTIAYEISVIDNPLKTIQEESRIYKNNITFNGKRFMLSFRLEELLNPSECQILLQALEFFSKDGKSLKYQLAQKYTFIELSTHKKETISAPQAISIDKIQGKAGSNLRKGITISKKGGNTSSPRASNSNQTLPVAVATKEDIRTLFEDSLQKFKAEIKEAKMHETLEKKRNSLDSNIKDFGMSLLCKLLLLVKYLNLLAENDFQEDLTTFLQHSFMENKALPGEI